MANSSWILLLVGTLLLISTYAIETKSSLIVGSRLENYLIRGESFEPLPKRSTSNNDENDSLVNIWILFKTKCDPIPPIGSLNQKTILRRQKHKVETTIDDSFVCVSFLDRLASSLKTGLSQPSKLRQVSKWLNGVSYEVYLSDLKKTVDLMHELDFVNEIEIVSHFVKTPDVSSDTKPIPIKNHARHYINGHYSALSDSSKESISTIKFSDQNVAQSVQNLNYGNSFNQLNRIGIPYLHKQGLDGTGVIIAVLDSGFNQLHDAFVGSHVIAAWDFVHNDSDVSDQPGESGQSNHGTGTWSNIGGRASGHLYGGSFNASFLLAKTEDTKTETSAEEDYFVAAVEWAESHGADILSASLGYDNWYKWSQFNGKTSIIARSVQKAIDNGMLLIVANGNSGNKGIGTPADLDRVVSVGALALDGSVASFSSLGPTSDGRIKPEVSAPGVAVLVADHSNIHKYKTSSGTSFATPLTAGAAGLLLQAHPEWTNMQLRDALMMTAERGANQPTISFGWGTVNATKAHYYTPPTVTRQQRMCKNPNGTWNQQKKTCVCAAGYYNLLCDTEILKCRSWCQGLCSTQGQCMCTSSNSRRCVSAPLFDNVAWTCSNSLYNDGKECNCGCGLYDPDCDLAKRLPVLGCQSSSNVCMETASNQSVCTDNSMKQKEPKHSGFLISLFLGLLSFLVR